MEEQKKTQGEAGGDSLFDGGFDTAVPERPWATLKRLWHTAQDQHLRLLVVCYTALAIAAPYYSAGIVDLLWENIQRAQGLGEAFVVTWRQGGREIFVLLLLYLGSWGFYTLQSYLMVGFAEQLNLRLRREMSEKLHRLPLSYLDSHQTGATLSHFTNDMDKMSEAMQYGILRLVTSVVLIVGSVVMMFRFNVVMTLLFLVFTLLSMVVTKLFSGVTLRRASRRQQALSQVTGLVEEAYSGRVVIKAFCREQASAGEIHRATEELAQATEKADFMMNAINPTVRLVNRLGQMGIAVFAGWQLLSGQLTVVVLKAFFQYVNQSAEPLTEASYVINSMQSALASAERVYRLLDAPEERPNPALPQRVDRARGQVEFRHVSFGYPPDRPLMKDISFAARPGQKVAIVGATGAGKTTLINLLMRFYEVDGGQILLDGVDTAAMTRENLRDNFGMVLQDTWLFDGTIAENIAYGKPDATREEIIEAARLAGAERFIMALKDGFDTYVGERGVKLSGGQKQRIAIARVFLKNPPILILDEATSALDNESEILVGQSLEKLAHGRTTLTIAHRLTTIKNYDRILVLGSEGIVESGTHEELLEQKGVYYRLWNQLPGEDTL